MDTLTVEIAREIVPGIDNLSVLQKGGQKIVFVGNDKVFGKIVLKLLRDKGSTDRVRREISIVMSNSFPNVPIIHKFDNFDKNGVKGLYIIEQYIEGDNLRSYMSQKGPLPFQETMNLISDLLTTLVELENRLIVHRDLKPENIVRAKTGRYWLLDFGIARDLCQVSLTETSANFGPHTMGYSAPEQIRNMKKKIDSRTDLFSLGVIVYEAISGSHPFFTGAHNPLEVLSRTETLIVPRLSIPEDKQYKYRCQYK